MREIASHTAGLLSDTSPNRSRHREFVQNAVKLCSSGRSSRRRLRHWPSYSRPPRGLAHPAARYECTLLGIESDKNRHNQAAVLLASGKGGGTALWSAIEDATIDQPVSLLYFNPPFDRIRGVGRMEHTLFNRVKEWPARATGLLLMIVPDYVLADVEVGLAVAVERDYELLGLWRYPSPEYQEFKQCVLLARRREKALNKTLMTFPRWAREPSKWPVLRDDMTPVATLTPRMCSGRPALALAARHRRSRAK